MLRWADCRAEDSLEQLYASFQNSEPHAMLMVGYPVPADVGLGGLFLEVHIA